MIKRKKYFVMEDEHDEDVELRMKMIREDFLDEQW